MTMRVSNAALPVRFAQQAARMHPARAPARATDADGNFGVAMQNAVAQVNQDQVAADRAVTEMVESQGANVHETMIALERADISLRLATKIGQKLVQAYQDISRIQL